MTISELRKRKPHGAVVSWLQGLRDDQLFLSAVTMGELQSGVDELIEDAMIAATARVHGFIVATRNEHDFSHFDVRVFNPFKAVVTTPQ